MSEDTTDIKKTDGEIDNRNEGNFVPVLLADINTDPLKKKTSQRTSTPG